MAGQAAATDEQTDFRNQLLSAGLLLSSGVPGVYGRGEAFEAVRQGVDGLISDAAAPDGAERLSFPPLLPRHELESIGYLKSFPHLAGSVFGFEGGDSEAADQFERASRHEDWSTHQRQTEVVLTPAACYPVYPAVGARGPLPDDGATVDCGGSYVFRNEPSGDPARLQMFHQRELVRIGSAESVLDWRDRWRKSAVRIFERLGLEATTEIATDPFFGRSGRLLAASQREQELKFEVSVPIASPEPTACASFNYHETHFADTYEITMANGAKAHTACLGFGLERIALALFRAHGLDPDGWPESILREVQHR